MLKGILGLLAACLILLSPVGSGAQAVTTQELVLTIAADENWNVLENEEGETAGDLTPMMIDGVPKLDFEESTLEFYEQHKMKDGYGCSADVLPNFYELISTHIEIRVLTFASEQNAVEFLDEFSNQILTTSAPDAQVAVMEQLPQTDFNLIGISSMTEFYDRQSGEPTDMAGSARYLAQIDSAVISIEVAGPLVDYNFDAAFWLTEAQAACVASGATCDPVTMPDGNGRWVLTEDGLMFVTQGDAQNEWARWIFPLEDPVAVPAYSVTLP